VFQVDVVWPGILGQHFLDLSQKAQGQMAQHFPPMVQSATIDGKLVAVPWFADAGLLYYRKDLLQKYGRPVPQTWEELTETARIVQEGERKGDNNGFTGFVWQGRAYEGLTTVALEWVSSHGGGTIVDEKGEITINNPKAVQALKTAAGWVGKISPRVSSTTPRRRRAASSKPATRPSCATGPMPGRSLKAATARSRTRLVSRRSRRAAPMADTRALSAGSCSRCRSTRRTPMQPPTSSCT
jgi:hypothetical protein